MFPQILPQAIAGISSIGAGTATFAASASGAIATFGPLVIRAISGLSSGYATGVAAIKADKLSGEKIAGSEKVDRARKKYMRTWTGRLRNCFNIAEVIHSLVFLGGSIAGVLNSLQVSKVFTVSAEAVKASGVAMGSCFVAGYFIGFCRGVYIITTALMDLKQSRASGHYEGERYAKRKLRSGIVMLVVAAVGVASALVTLGGGPVALAIALAVISVTIDLVNVQYDNFRKGLLNSDSEQFRTALCDHYSNMFRNFRDWFMAKCSLVCSYDPTLRQKAYEYEDRQLHAHQDIGDYDADLLFSEHSRIDWDGIARDKPELIRKRHEFARKKHRLLIKMRAFQLMTARQAA